MVNNYSKRHLVAGMIAGAGAGFFGILIVLILFGIVIAAVNFAAGFSIPPITAVVLTAFLTFAFLLGAVIWLLVEVGDLQQEAESLKSQSKKEEN